MNKKSLYTLILFLAILGLLFSANAFAGQITFSGRTFVNGVQVGGVTVKIWGNFETLADGQKWMRTGPHTAVSGSNGEYRITFYIPTGYEPISADIQGSSPAAYPYDYCIGRRHVSMDYGDNRRHIYVTCYDTVEPPY